MNLIDALDGTIGSIANGPMHQFSYDRNGTFRMIDIDHTLRGYGVRIWGRDLGNPDVGRFIIRQGQAKWAEYVLLRAGVPLTSAPIDRRNRQYADAYAHDTMPTRWNEEGLAPNSIIDRAVDWVASLAGITIASPSSRKPTK